MTPINEQLTRTDSCMFWWDIHPKNKQLCVFLLSRQSRTFRSQKSNVVRVSCARGIHLIDAGIRGWMAWTEEEKALYWNEPFGGARSQFW
jgi:hypothetical protein